MMEGNLLYSMSADLTAGLIQETPCQQHPNIWVLQHVKVTTAEVLREGTPGNRAAGTHRRADSSTQNLRGAVEYVALPRGG